MDLMYGAAGSGQTPGAGVEISRREEEGTCGSLVSEKDDRGESCAVWNQILQLATGNNSYS
jgi:hypothetical protein